MIYSKHTNSAKSLMFVDNTKLKFYFNINSTLDNDILLNSIVSWSKKWSLSFNPTKSEVIRYKQQLGPHVIKDIKMIYSKHTNSAKSLMFVDNTKLKFYFNINSTLDNDILLNSIVSWSKKWSLSFNPTKSEVIRYKQQLETS